MTAEDARIGSATRPASRSGGAKRPRTVSDRVLGWVGAGMMLVAAYLLVAALLRDDAPVAATIPELEIVSPRDQGEASLPLQIHFRSAAPLSVQPGGWGAGGFHVHAELSGREAMPGPDDIRPMSDGSYVWTVGGASPGPITLRLFWSDSQHRPVAAQATDPIRITLR